jgi:hypothetical protein
MAPGRDPILPVEIPVVERTSARSLLWPGYAIALLLIAFPLADLVTNIWPLRPGAVEWRFGTVGLLSGFILTPLLGIVGVIAVAAALGHRGVLRLVAVVSLGLAAATVATLGLFALDWLQMRSTVEAEVRQGLDIGSIKAALKHGLTVITLGWLGLVGWRVSRPQPEGTRGRGGAPLVRTGGPEPGPAGRS